MAYAELLPTRFGKRLLFNETQFFAASPAEIRLLLEAGGSRAFAVD